jgi:hypothetical protein
MLLPRALWVVGDAFAELYPPTLFVESYGAPLWRWCAADDPAMPAHHCAAFAVLDECRPASLLGREVVVVSASSGGVAVIDRATGTTVFSALLHNAHSAAVLPDGTLIGAASEGGDRLVRWRLDAVEALASVPLPHAHAVVPDARRGLLWSGGARQVVAFDLALEQAEPRVVISMPDDDVHDLVWDAPQISLLCSTRTGVWSIDPDTRSVAPWTPLARVRLVKGLAPPIDGGPLCFHKGEGGTWWSETVYALGGGPCLAMVRFPGRHLYKVRWDPP